MNANGQIMMTYRCSAACRHCLVMSSPQQSRRLVSVADAVEYGRDFRALGRDVMQEIQVDPYGFVRPDWCPGVNLGNTRQARVARLCRTQHVLETPLLRDLVEGGPAALLPLARRHGIEPRPAYASKCHMCFDLRRRLVEHMPAEFGPPNLYAENA